VTDSPSTAYMYIGYDEATRSFRLLVKKIQDSFVERLGMFEHGKMSAVVEYSHTGVMEALGRGIDMGNRDDMVLASPDHEDRNRDGGKPPDVHAIHCPAPRWTKTSLSTDFG